MSLEGIPGPTDPSVLLATPGCRVYNTANQSIPNNTATPIAFNAERYDTGNMHDNVVNNSRITIPQSGVYVVGCTVEWATNATGERDLNLRVNGTTYLYVGFNPASGGIQRLAAHTVWRFAAGDYIEFLAFQLSTVALNLVSSVVATGPNYFYSPEAWAQLIAT